MELNSQPIQKVQKKPNPDGAVDVHSIFYTIQGEGPFCGTPAIFVRLAGCNLQCPLCDTEYTDKAVRMNPSQIINAFKAAITDSVGYKVADAITEGVKEGRTRQLVVLTGGEPLRQQITPLLEALCAVGYYVQVETNGTLTPPEFHPYASAFYNSTQIADQEGVYVVCSPKTGFVSPKLVEVACCFKYVAQASDMGEDGLPNSALGHVANPRLARPPKLWERPIYLQPADEQDAVINAANTAAVTEACMTHGYTVQIQIHKLLGVE